MRNEDVKGNDCGAVSHVPCLLLCMPKALTPLRVAHLWGGSFMAVQPSVQGYLTTYVPYINSQGRRTHPLGLGPAKAQLLHTVQGLSLYPQKVTENQDRKI